MKSTKPKQIVEGVAISDQGEVAEATTAYQAYILYRTFDETWKIIRGEGATPDEAIAVATAAGFPSNPA